MTLKKFYEPVKKQYYYLSSARCDLLENNGVSSFSWKWFVPSIFIRNGEVKIKNISAINANAGTKYVIRLNSPQVDNCYDSMYGDPILFTSLGLNDTTFVDTPELRIHNKQINHITIKVTNSIQPDNRDNGIPQAVSFVILLEISDYEPEDTSYSYNVNDKQNNNPRIV
jgi:hypothetical protein